MSTQGRHIWDNALIYARRQTSIFEQLPKGTCSLRGFWCGCQALSLFALLFCVLSLLFLPCLDVVCFPFLYIFFCFCSFAVALATALRIGCLHAASPRNLARVLSTCKLSQRLAPSENTLKAIKWAIFTINGKIKYRFFCIFGPVWRFDAQVRLESVWVSVSVSALFHSVIVLLLLLLLVFDAVQLAHSLWRAMWATWPWEWLFDSHVSTFSASTQLDVKANTSAAKFTARLRLPGTAYSALGCSCS